MIGESSQKKQDPLLPTSTPITRSSQTAPSGFLRNRSKNTSSSTRTVGLCGHLFILSLPLIGASLVLTTLVLLVANGGNSISNISISLALTNYQPFWEILTLLTLAAIVVFVVTISRNIQIGVYVTRHAQNSTRTCLRFLNLVAAATNIAAYTGLIVLAVFPIDAETQWGRQLHTVGSVTFFVGTVVYGLLHAFLLVRQTQYATLWKALFGLLAVAVLICISIFGADRSRTAFEWYAVFLSAAYVGLFAILFHVDPVDDEIRDFFMCRRTRR